MFTEKFEIYSRTYGVYFLTKSKNSMNPKARLINKLISTKVTIHSVIHQFAILEISFL